MSGIIALLYADTRALVNAIRDIRRSGGRAVLWLVALLVVALSLALRVFSPRHAHGGDIVPLVTCDLIVSLAVVPPALLLAHGSPLVGLFANRLEAQWIIGSPISPFLATVYLQLRELARFMPRMILTFGYVGMFYLPRTLGPALVGRDLAFGFLLLAGSGALLLPRKLAHGPLAALAVVAGYGCAIAAAIPVLHDAALLPLPAPLGALFRALPAWHPGLVLLEPAGPHGIAVATGLALIALGAVALLGVVARDTYPELYALSVARMERTGQIGFRRFGLFNSSRTVTNRPAETTAARVPGGVGVFAWKAWTEYRRRSSPRATAFETAGLLVGGFALARIASRAPDELWLQLAVMSFTIMLIATIGFGVSLARELRRPMFWLSDATLFARLSGLLAGHTVRFVGWFWLFAIGLAGGGAGPMPLVVAAIAEPALLVLLATIGYAACAAFPQEIDQRGPLALLRLLVSYILVIPAIVAGTVVGVLERSATGGLLAGAGVSLLEALVLLYLAAWRLDTAALPLA